MKNTGAYGGVADSGAVSWTCRRWLSPSEQGETWFGSRSERRPAPSQAARQVRGDRRRPRTGCACRRRQKTPPGGRFFALVVLSLDHSASGPGAFRYTNLHPGLEDQRVAAFMQKNIIPAVMLDASAQPVAECKNLDG